MFYRSIGINLKQLYGSTETSVFVCVQPTARCATTPSARPWPAWRSAWPTTARSWSRAPACSGVLPQQRRHRAHSSDGWFRTGDAGYLDTDGQLKIIDRAKDVGKLADGSLFAPKYIENKLKFFPHIKEAVAFGAGREDVCAFINIDLEAVGNWAERRGMPYAGYTDLASKDEVYQ